MHSRSLQSLLHSSIEVSALILGDPTEVDALGEFLANALDDMRRVCVASGDDVVTGVGYEPLVAIEVFQSEEKEAFTGFELL